MASDDNSAGVFTRASSTYGQVGPNLFGHFGARVVRRTAVGSGCSALDVACGTGAALVEASRAAGPAGLAVGVDLTVAMLGRTAAIFQQPNLAAMDAHALGFADNSFDVITSNFALTYFSNPLAALTECGRVLRPGGRVGLVVHDGWWWHDDPLWEWHVDLLAELGNTRATTPRLFCDTDSVSAVVAQAGFINIRTTIEPFELQWADPSDWWDWCWSHGYRAVLEQFDAATLREFERVCRSRLQRGPIRGSLPVICLVASKAR